ncbi:trypsin delta/gamma-like protein CG30031 [Drosophila erecta]|uniref:trypsin n=1 Tax=Drosophila erecta TaxID=7220 RepID=B3N9T3_DROER|nr:trypsin delta/gamma-like protein CG30031 [Drosophila erecta]EDV58578.1 uncharacterized protein Dere_GG10155 [Drosophila erecta]
MFIETFLLLLALNSLSAGRESRPEGRVLGGKPIEIEQAPWQVSLHHRGNFKCGGSIYSENIIITAAHCFFTGTERVDDQGHQVRIGSALKYSNGSLVEVDVIKIHENFNVVNDIAIVRLNKPLVFTNKVQPIPLAKKNPFPGSIAFVSGWGISNYPTLEHPEHPEHLQGLNLPIQSSNNPSLLWAGNTGRAACRGDSGGPLVANKQLVGVVSGGSEYCEKSSYYSSVPYFHEWILTAIASIK